MSNDDMDDDSEKEFVETDMEKEFKKAQEVAMEKINAKIAEAAVALSEAVKVSEEYGVPFTSEVSFLYNTYTPDSFEEKFSEVDRDWLNEVAEIYVDGYSGWEHSAVC
jgi:hypothetical protein